MELQKNNLNAGLPAPQSNLNTAEKVKVRVDRLALTPQDSVPLARRHKFLFQLALLYLGEKAAEIPKACLRDRALLHLKYVVITHFENSSWDETLVRSLNAAFEAVEEGKNNLHRSQQHTDGPFELWV
jgi:hypothetical protein